jgi:two-component system, LytTR family, response regulator
MRDAATLRVLIVDDERPGRDGVRARLQHLADIEVVGECGSGREAVQAIRTLTPDVVFLDVQMPGGGGFDVVDQVGPQDLPIIIFVTAWDQHAIRAFEAHALDYLLKPIDDDRFEQALDRARRRVREQRESALGRRLSAAFAEAGTVPSVGYDAAHPEPQRIDRFLVRQKDRVVVIPVEDVDWIEAAGDYVTLHAGRMQYHLRETMSRIEQRLDPQRFARIHRSTIVNLARIRELQPHLGRDYVVILADSTRLRLSRGYRDRIERLFGGSL